MLESDTASQWSVIFGYSHIVKGLDPEILHEIDTFSAAVSIRAITDPIRWSKPAFVTKSNHVLAVETFNILADLRCPVVDDTCVAAVASRFVRELPSENRGAAFVSVDKQFDVGFVDFLVALVREPCRRVATKGCVIRCYSAECRPIVYLQSGSAVQAKHIFAGYGSRS